jgi:signal transduction histidine kinase
MSDIVWTIKSGNDRFENVWQRMNQFATEILDSENMEMSFRTEPSLYTVILTMEQRKNFYLFFKEAINNVAKHARASRVEVNVLQKRNHIVMTIDDNGRGFDTRAAFSGNGMTSLKKRAHELNADLDIRSHLDKGTSVQLKFKITRTGKFLL